MVIDNANKQAVEEMKQRYALPLIPGRKDRQVRLYRADEFRLQARKHKTTWMRRAGR